MIEPNKLAGATAFVVNGAATFAIGAAATCFENHIILLELRLETMEVRLKL